MGFGFFRKTGRDGKSRISQGRDSKAKHLCNE